MIKKALMALLPLGSLPGKYCFQTNDVKEDNVSAILNKSVHNFVCVFQNLNIKFKYCFLGFYHKIYELPLNLCIVRVTRLNKFYTIPHIATV